MTLLDMGHSRKFLNFRNKQKRLQQKYSTSLCGLTSSQYHSMHFVQKTMHTEKRKRKEGDCSVIFGVAHYSINFLFISYLLLSSHKTPRHL